MIDARKTKAEVAYQAVPNRRMQCHMCLYFVPTDACKLVKGAVNSRGWCDLYKSEAMKAREAA